MLNAKIKNWTIIIIGINVGEKVCLDEMPFIV